MGGDEDIEIFAEVGGLVWDTTQLFTLLMAVRDGRATSNEARGLLRSASGRLVVPVSWELT
jgi:hypothetical protein